MMLESKHKHLRELLAGVGPYHARGPIDRPVTRLECHSRRAGPATLFAALRGAETDGHEFALEAVDRGATVVLADREIWTQSKATLILVPDSRKAFARVAAAFHGHPSKQLKVIGVTGATGKTTVAFMLKQILEGRGIRTGLISSLRHEVGARRFPAHRTTPESAELQRMLAGMARAGQEVCVLEVSPQALAQERIAGIEFEMVILTNLSELSVDGSEAGSIDFDRYVELARPLSSKRGSAVVNIDDSRGRTMAGRFQARAVVTFGIEQPAMIQADQVELDSRQVTMRLKAGGQTRRCSLSIPGRHNVYNALAAVGAGMAMGASALDCIRGLESMTPPPGRLEPVYCGQPFSVYVDYAHSPAALRAVLSVVREITAGRLLLVFGCGGGRSTEYRRRMGEIAAAGADLSIITTDNPRRTCPARIASDMEAGFGRGTAYRIELNRTEAIEWALREASPGDAVVIAGKGHETFQEFADTVVPFDDRAVAAESLEGMGWTVAGETSRFEANFTGADHELEAVS